MEIPKMFIQLIIVSLHIDSLLFGAIDSKTNFYIGDNKFNFIA